MALPQKKAFTLVELLVVIAIIGILVSMLLPAVQAAREAGRRTQCKNNIRQIALACNLHRTKQGFYPSGGWGWGWAGDPDRGYTYRQPGGWCYNILPYIEQEALRLMGADQDDTTKRAMGKTVASTAINLFYCPSRRRAIPYPYVHSSPYYNIDKPDVIGRIDYAANGGDLAPSSIAKGPGSISAGDGMNWGTDSNTEDALKSTGVSFLHSQVSVIPDGDSNTYLVGERYCNPDTYAAGTSSADDQGWITGYDWDTVRWGNENLPPLRDRAGTEQSQSYGSVHSAGWNMALCDGSVRTLTFAIDLPTHRRLACRSDHEPIDQSMLPQN